MIAFNAVRFRVKSERDQEFLDAHKVIAGSWPGLRHVNIIKTGDRSYCIIAEWTDMDALTKARPKHDRDAQFIPRRAGGLGWRAWFH